MFAINKFAVNKFAIKTSTTKREEGHPIYTGSFLWTKSSAFCFVVLLVVLSGKCLGQIQA